MRGNPGRGAAGGPRRGKGAGTAGGPARGAARGRAHGTSNRAAGTSDAAGAGGASGAGGARGAASAGDGRRDRTDAQVVTGLLEPVISNLGMDLEGVKVSMAGRRRLLRLVVDADGGVSLDDVAAVSRRVCASLDAGAAFGDAPYTLEISSPGVDRPLTLPRHWRRAVGRLVAVPLAAEPPAGPVPVGPDGAGVPRTRIEGRVSRADEHDVTIKVDGADRVFGYAQLGPGQVQVEFGRLDELQDEEDSDGH